MWEYFVQNRDLWILAALSVPAIYINLWYQIVGWRRGTGDLTPVAAIYVLALVGSFILQDHVPYPPFTWLQWLYEAGAGDCPPSGCRGQGMPHFLAVIFFSVPISAVTLLILWGPWLLSPWRRQYVEMCKAPPKPQRYFLKSPDCPSQYHIAPNRDSTEYTKHGTCEKCGGPLRPKYSDEWDCPACSATFRKRYGTRLLKAVSWGGVTALASFLFFSFVGPEELHEDVTPVSISAFVWVIVTVVILSPGDNR